MKKIILLTFLPLAACACPEPADWCPQVLRASIPVKTWFREANPPGPVLDYLDQIGKQQESIEKNCPKP